MQISDELKRAVRMSYLLKTVCSVKLFINDEATVNYANTMFNHMLPFFNEFEALIVNCVKNRVAITSNDLNNLFDKHEDDCKHFYSIVENLMFNPKTTQIVAEHALGREVKKVNFHINNTEMVGSKMLPKFLETEITIE